MNVQIWIDGGALSAFGGAFIGGVFVIIGGWLVHHWQQKARKEKERETFRNVLRALKLEFEEFWASYKNSLEIIETQYPDKKNEVLQLMKQEHFSVYNGNVSILSQLQDEELQRLIIRTHMAFRALQDKIEGKNITINKIDEYSQICINSDQETTVQENRAQKICLLLIELMREELKKQSSALEKTHEEIDRLMKALIPKLNETIQSLK